MQFKKIWKEKNLFYKILLILGFIISITVIVLSFLAILGIYNKGFNLAVFLLGTLMVIQAIENYKINKKLTYYSLIVSVFIFLIFLFYFF